MCSQRFLATLLGVGLLWSVEAPGLGLGDIELNSHLNQPLSAEISLLAVNPDEIDQITVKLADRAAYDAAGIERLDVLSDIVFNIQRNSQGHVEIAITTKGNIKEPFLDFIVEVNWPGGRILREYTLLLDPPVFTSQRAGAVVAPEMGFSIESEETLATKGDAEPQAVGQSDRSQSTQATPATSTPLSVAPPAPRSLANSRGGVSNVDPLSAPAPQGQVRVKRNENLWGVAEQMLTDKGLSVEQRMLGIFRTNPEAFIDDNINNLKAGYVLRVPSESTVAELSKSEAARISRQHYQEWISAKRLAATSGSGRASSSGLAAGLAEGVASPATRGAAQARLSLASPDATEADGARAATGADPSGLSSGDLAVVMEQAKSSQAESAELKARISALEEQLAMMERLITLKDDALVEMQRQLGQENQTAAVSGVDIETLKDPAEVLSQVKDGEAVQAEAVPAKPQVKQPVVQVEKEAADEVGILDMLLNPQILMLGVGALLIIAAALLVIRKRRAGAEAGDYELHDFQPDYGQEMDDGAEGYKTAAKNNIQLDNEMDFSGLSGNDVTALSEADAFAGADIDSFQADEVDIDPIAEADVYLAYRRFQQAEDLIKEAMQRHPERSDFQVKLLEIYFAAGNKLGFESQAEALFAALGGQTGGVWKSVSEMGCELCPGHPLFGGKDQVADSADNVNEDPLADIATELPEVSDSDSQNMSAMDAFNVDEEVHEVAGVDDSDQLSESSVTQEESDFSAITSDMDFSADQAQDSVVQAEDAFAYSEEPSSSLPDDESANSLEFESGLGAEKKIVVRNEGQEENGGTEQRKQVEETNSLASGLLDSEQTDHASLAEGSSELDFSSMSFEALDDTVEGSAENNLLADLELPADSESIPSSDAQNADELSTDELLASFDEEGDNIIEELSQNYGELEEVFTGLADSELGSGGDDDLFGGADMIGTKLDLARAYIDMEDHEGARGILQEVLEEGSDAQKQEAQEMMQKIG